MFPSQMVHLKIVEPSSGKSFSMFNSEMVCLKIVKPSSLPLFAYFTRKWYALKLSNPQVAHFFYVSLANGTPENCLTLKWPTLSMFPSQMVRLKIVKPSSGTLFSFFNRKFYVLKLSNPKVSHFFNVSLANVTP